MGTGDVLLLAETANGSEGYPTVESTGSACADFDGATAIDGTGLEFRVGWLTLLTFGSTGVSALEAAAIVLEAVAGASFALSGEGSRAGS